LDDSDDDDEEDATIIVGMCHIYRHYRDNKPKQATNKYRQPNIKTATTMYGCMNVTT
jgi:hypothetical protein